MQKQQMTTNVFRNNKRRGKLVCTIYSVQYNVFPNTRSINYE